jgi:hypothetical protein
VCVRVCLRVRVCACVARNQCISGSCRHRVQRVVCILDLVSLQSDGKGRHSNTGTCSPTAQALAVFALATANAAAWPQLTRCCRSASTRRRQGWTRITTEKRRMPAKGALLTLQVGVQGLFNACRVPALLRIQMCALPPLMPRRFPRPRQLDRKVVRRRCKRQCCGSQNVHRARSTHQRQRLRQAHAAAPCCL